MYFILMTMLFKNSNVIIPAPKESYAANWASHHGMALIEE